MILVVFAAVPRSAEAQTFTQSVNTGSGFSSGGTVDVGDVYIYRFQYSFPSTTGSFSGVSVTSQLPSELQYISQTDSPHIESSSESNGLVTFHFVDSLPSGATGELLVRVRFPTGTITGVQAETNATMSGTGGMLPLMATPVDVTVTALNGADPVGTSNGVQVVKSSDAAEVYLGSGLTYFIQHGSLGGEAIGSYVLEDTFPPEFIFEQWRHAQPFDENLVFEVNYRTNINGSLTAWPNGPFNTDDSTGAAGRRRVSDLSLADGEFVTALQFVFSNVPAGTDYVFATGARIAISGDVTTLNTNSQPEDVNGGAVAVGTMLQNTVTLETGGQYPLASSTVNTNLGVDQAVYGLQKTILPDAELGNGAAPYNPGEFVEVALSALSLPVNVEDLVNPTLWDLLPPELEYVGPIVVSPIRGSDPQPPLPDFQAFPNWNGTGRTLLKFFWSETNPYTISPTSNRSGVRIQFRAQIPFGVSDGNYTNQVVGTLENPHICQNANREFIDENDFDSDGVTAEIFCGARPARFEVFDDGTGVGLNSQKWVKGQCDLDFTRFPETGSTVPGGTADYELRILNAGAVTVRDIDVIDILPYVGDTGVVDTSPRLSEWEPVLAGPVTAPTVLPPGVSSVAIFYSTSRNPDRTNLGLTIAGADDLATTNWTSIPPEDITMVSSLRFKISGSLAPGENLVFGWPMRAPLDAPTNGEIAWNSFGFAATNDDTGSRLLATEPVKVGFEVKPPSPASYGDFVWFDTNRNGIQEPSEGGINGVRVELYRPDGGLPDPENDDLVTFTVTQNDGSEDGGYLFSDLEGGNYYAVFYPPVGFVASPGNQGSSDERDSDGEAGMIQGQPVFVTEITALSGTEEDGSWDQGFYDPVGGITIGDFVWIDRIPNGVQDSVEEGIPGVTVKLVRTGDGEEIGSSITSTDGLYLFGGINDENLSDSTLTTPGSARIQIAASSDDATQRGTASQLTNTDLDLGLRDVGNNATNAQTVGLRFNNVAIPQGAVITNAFLQFSANDVTANANQTRTQLNGGNPPPEVSLIVYGEDADNPATFSGGAGGPLNRIKTDESATWAPPLWEVAGERGVGQQATGLEMIVQEIVDRGGWASGSSMVFLIEGGGQREAESFDGVPAGAAELFIEWNVESTVENSLEAGVDYEICIDTTQSALDPYALIATGTTDTSNDPGTDGVDSDAFLDGSDAVIAYTGDADGTFNTSLDFGFRVDVACFLDVVSVDGRNYDVASSTFDLLVRIDYIGAPDTGSGSSEVSFVVNGQTYTRLIASGPGTDGAETFLIEDVVIGTSVEAFFTGFQGVGDKSDTESLVTPEVGIGNLVWNDGNNNGVFDPGERTVDGLTIELWIDLDADGLAEPTGDDAAQTPLTTVTAGGGGYGFGGLVPGGYFVRIPTVSLSSLNPQSSDDGVDNDDNGNQPGGVGTEILSSVITLSPAGEAGGGSIDNAVDFGLIQPGIGNLVWEDLDGDGQVDANEPGIPGVVLQLFFDADNNGGLNGTELTVPIRTTSTNPDGFYLFGDLGPGNYQVIVPEENFEVGGALERLRLSASPSNLSDSSIDDDDNGNQSGEASTTVSGPFLALSIGGEVVDGLGSNEESGRGAELDNEDDASGDMTVDFGFVQEAGKANSYRDFLVIHAEVFNLDDNSQPGVPASDPLTGMSTGSLDTDGDDGALATLGGNSDRDVFGNLLEYALCFDPGSGTKTFPDGTPNEGFHLEMNEGSLDLKFTRPLNAADVAYRIQSSSDGSIWVDEATVEGAIFSAGITVSPGAVSGTEEVCFSDLVSEVAEESLLRLSVVSTGGGFEGFSPILGYQQASILDFCQTYSDPLMMSCVFTGVIDETNVRTDGVISLTTSVGSGSLLDVLSGGGNYYLEVTSGDQVGHRFDVSSFTADTVVLSADPDLFSPFGPFNTRTDFPADLAGDSVVIREHQTLVRLFPADDPLTTETEGFAVGTNINNSANLIWYDRDLGQLETFFLTEMGWIYANGSALADGFILAPTEGIFVHNLEGEASFPIMQFGEVRTTRAACPLAEGYNLIGAAHPLIDQSIDSSEIHSRNMNDSVGRDFFGSGSRANSDQVLVWVDDSNDGSAPPHLCYDLIFYLNAAGFNQWSLGGDITANDLSSDQIFQADRSYLHHLYANPNTMTSDEKLFYSIPSPIPAND